jgi:hypothetical protein
MPANACGDIWQSVMSAQNGECPDSGLDVIAVSTGKSEDVIGNAQAQFVEITVSIGDERV